MADSQPLYIFVFGMAKSASRRFTNVVRALPPDPFPRKNLVPGYAENRSYEVEPALAEEFPDGGAFHIQSAPTDRNIETISALSGKVFVTIRHPADQLTAVNRHANKPKRMEKRVDNADVKPHRPKHLSVENTIRDRLAQWMDWAAWWIERAPEVNACIVRYEDFITDTETMLRQTVIPHLGVPASEERIRAAMKEMSLNQRKRDQINDPSIYPRGWTGSEGTWRNYFSDQDVESYNAHIYQYLEAQPKRRLLLQFYDSLTL